MSGKKIIGWVVGVCLAGLALAIAWSIMLPVFQFRAPVGPYAIGTVTYHWIDASRAEQLAAGPNARRELMAQIWYPARAEPSSPRAPYLQDAAALANALAGLQRWPAFIFGPLKNVKTHALASAAVANDKTDYPVLIFLEGAIGFRQMNTFQVEALVSHGYIVVAIDQPHTAATVVFPNGRQAIALPLGQMMPLIHQSHSPSPVAPMLSGRPFPKGIVPYLAQDVGFALDQLTALNQTEPKSILTGRLDLQHVGVFGISLGGIVAAEACRVEPRLRACLFMDAPMPVDVVKSGLQQPGMWITRDADTMRLERRRSGGWSEADINEHQTSMRAAFEALQGDAYFVQVPGLFHVNLTDIPYWSPLLPWLGVTGPLDGMRGHEIISAYSLAFFDWHLLAPPQAPSQTRSPPLLDGPSSRYPEVLIEIRRP
jgi:hypothetical protein